MLKVWEKHKYTLMTFVAFTALWLAGDGWMTGKKFLDIGALYHTLYYADISIGFVSRTFVATVLKFLTGDNITMETVLATINLNTLFAIVLFSVLIGSTIRKNKDNKMMCALTCVLAFSSVSLLNIISYGWTFTLDTYWLPVALLSIFFIKNKILRWFIPLLSFVGIWIHYAYGLALFPLVFLLLLYEMYENKQERKSLTVLAVVTALVGIASLIYFVFIANLTLAMNAEQAHHYISSRMPECFERDFTIIDAYCFSIYDGEQVNFTFKEISGLGIADALKTLLGTGAILGGFGLDEDALLSQIPLLALIEALWIYVFVKCKDKLFRFILLFNICYPIVTYLSIVLSTDDLRFASFGLVGQLGSLIWLLAAKNEHVTKTAEKITALFEKHSISVAVILCFIVVCTEMAQTMAVVDFLKSVTLVPIALLLILQKRRLAVVLFVICSIFFKLNYAVTIGTPFLFMLLIDAISTDEAGLYIRELSFKKNYEVKPSKKKNTEKKLIDELKAQKIVLATIILFVIITYYIVQEVFISKLDNPSFSSYNWTHILSPFILLSAFTAVLAIIMNRKGIQKSLCVLVGVIPEITGVVCILYGTSSFNRYSFRHSAIIVILFSFTTLVTLPYKKNQKAFDVLLSFENESPFETYFLISVLLMLPLIV